MTKSNRWSVFKGNTYLNVAILPDVIKSGGLSYQTDGKHCIRSAGDNLLLNFTTRGDQNV